MHPVFLKLGEFTIYWYGVFVAAGFLAAVAHWNFLGRREGRPEGFGSELGLWIMVAGIVGARLAYIAANLSLFVADPKEIFMLHHGGLIFYGGFIGAAVAIVILARMHHERVLSLADFTVSALPLGHTLGRIGCFMNGCCYGAPCSLPWGVTLEGALRHPTQLYEAGFNLLVYGALWVVYRRKHVQGQVLAAYLLIYPVGRFLIEFLRGDERVRWAGLSVAQLLSVALLACGLALWFAVRPKPEPRHG